MAHCCAAMDQHLHEGEVAISYIPKFREYGIKILDGGSSVQRICFCPWCGAILPSSLRSAWFDMLEILGIDPDDEQAQAEKFQSEAWWREAQA